MSAQAKPIESLLSGLEAHYRPDFFTGAVPAVPRSALRACTVAIDAEEGFDWRYPVRGTSYVTEYMHNIREPQGIFRAYGIVPVYLLTYPVLEDAGAVSLLRRYVGRGECILGVQLHSWVTPPFESDTTYQDSFASNLDPNLEEQKLLSLVRKFQECFGFAPKVYRAGRYGIGRQTALLLEKHGFEIDTSVAPRSSFRAEGGPEFSDADYELFWFGRHRKLLEMPLCRSIVGWGGEVGRSLFQFLSASHARARLCSVLTRLRCAERVTLSPEGNDAAAMKRFVRHMLGSNRTILTVSFHSSSFTTGGNPYVSSRADLHGFYDRLSEILDYMVCESGFLPRNILEIPELLVAPAAAEAVFEQA